MINDYDIEKRIAELKILQKEIEKELNPLIDKMKEKMVENNITELEIDGSKFILTSRNDSYYDEAAILQYLVDNNLECDRTIAHKKTPNIEGIKELIALDIIEVEDFHNKCYINKKIPVLKFASK